MKQRCLVFALFSIFLAGPLLAEDMAKPVRPLGFYEGTVLIFAHGGSPLSYGGSLFAHDRDVDASMQAEVRMGPIPLMILALRPFASTFLFSPEFSAGPQAMGGIEYGISDHFGMGVSWEAASFTVARQEEFPILGGPFYNPAANPSGTPNFYMEATAMRRSFYKENLLLAEFSYHLLPRHRVDPYVVVRLGGGAGSAAYRRIYDPSWNVMHAGVPVTTVAGGAGIGANISLLEGEFGFKVEASGLGRSLKSDAFSHQTVSTGVLSAGIFCNLDSLNWRPPR